MLVRSTAAAGTGGLPCCSGVKLLAAPGPQYGRCFQELTGVEAESSWQASAVLKVDVQLAGSSGGDGEPSQASACVRMSQRVASQRAGKLVLSASMHTTLVERAVRWSEENQWGWIRVRVCRRTHPAWCGHRSLKRRLRYTA